MGSFCSCNCVSNDPEKASTAVNLEPAADWRLRKQAASESTPPENNSFFPEERHDTQIVALQSIIRSFLVHKILKSQRNDELDFSYDESILPQGTADALIDPETLLTDKALQTLRRLPQLSLDKGVRGVTMQAPKYLMGGGVYSGEWSIPPKAVVPRGKGKMYSADGSYSEGYWKNGELHIFGRNIYSNGDYYEGNFNNGQRTGNGTFQTFDQKCTYVGQWKDDVRCGKGREGYPDGSYYDGEYANDIKTGVGAMHWADGSSYEGQFLNEKITGTGTYRWADGRVYIGEWLDGQMHGLGSFKYADGKTYTGEYSHDKKNGRGVYRWPGHEYDGEWLDGKMHGFGYITKKAGGRKRYEFRFGDRLREVPDNTTT